MRNHHARTDRPGGVYQVYGSPCPVDRPNRTAAGMTAQNFRKKRRSKTPNVTPKLTYDALRLLVRGTHDVLAGHPIRTVKKACACCGAASGKLEMKRDGNSKGGLKIRLRSVKLNPARLP